MGLQNAKEDIQFILSFFSEIFSRPSFKIFSSFVVSFIQSGKEAHTSSMVQSLTHPFLRRSLSSFTRFLGENVWAMEEVAEVALSQFFRHLRIKTHSVLFLIVDDTIAKKTGKKIPGCSWHKDGARKPHVFGHQWVLFALLYKDFLLPPSVPNSIIPKAPKDAALFGPKSNWLKRCFRASGSRSLVNSTSWQIAGIGGNPWLDSPESMVTI